MAQTKWWGRSPCGLRPRWCSRSRLRLRLHKPLKVGGVVITSKSVLSRIIRPSSSSGRVPDNLPFGRRGGFYLHHSATLTSRWWDFEWTPTGPASRASICALSFQFPSACLRGQHLVPLLHRLIPCAYCSATLLRGGP